MSIDRREFLGGSVSLAVAAAAGGTTVLAPNEVKAMSHGAAAERIAALQVKIDKLPQHVRVEGSAMMTEWDLIKASLTTCEQITEDNDVHRALVAHIEGLLNDFERKYASVLEPSLVQTAFARVQDFFTGPR